MNWEHVEQEGEMGVSDWSSKKSKQRELEGLKTMGMVLSLQVFDIAHGRCGRQAAMP
jgi:hypothetical protein